MTLHASTFEYLKPTDGQLETMAASRYIFAEFAQKLDDLLLDGPDKTYTLRMLRDVAMWANICITRNPDGSPRS